MAKSRPDPLLGLQATTDSLSLEPILLEEITCTLSQVLMWVILVHQGLYYTRKLFSKLYYV